MDRLPWCSIIIRRPADMMAQQSARLMRKTLNVTPGADIATTTLERKVP